MEKTVILVTGATGYIGGNVLSRLLTRPDSNSFEFRALLRSAEKAEKLKTFGVIPIVGSHSDEDVMIKAASEADIVLLMADSDDLQMIQMTLLGLRKRHESTGKISILINTSGTGIISDNAAGMYASDVIYDDTFLEHLEALSPTAPHRPVDLPILAADREGYIKSYIIAPSAVYSTTRNSLTTAGISKSNSIVWELLTYLSFERGQAGMVGEGKNIWPNVDIDELTNLYDLLLDSILKDPNTTPHGREGIFFAHSDESEFYKISKKIAEVMFKLEKSATDEPSSFVSEEFARYKIASYFGCNFRCKSSNATRLGWRPVKTSKDFLDSMEAEVKHQLAVRSSGQGRLEEDRDPDEGQMAFLERN
ncbi:NAD-binding protein [Marasmius fiardii PR-910]|nr:NAD-binding protein [Marasmius fiardii PR-910]